VPYTIAAGVHTITGVAGTTVNVTAFVTVE
jgi:hypothetical protein